MILSEHPAFVVLAVALAAPLLAQMPIVSRLPVIVLEVLLGIVVGPQMLGWIRVDGFLAQMIIIGTGAVLFMAGMEIDFKLIRGRPLNLALGGWAVTIAVGLAAVALLHIVPGVDAPMMVTLALATTSLGALLPAMRDSGQLETPYGRLLLAAGTVGEVAPTVAVALLLSRRYSTWEEFGFLLLFLGLVSIAAFAGTGLRHPRLLALLERTLHASTQLPVRIAMFVVAAFFTLSDAFGLEGILGAFAAGMVVGLATKDEAAKPFRAKVEAVSFGFLTPFFYVGTGAAFDLQAATANFATMLLIPSFLLLLLLVHGIPVLLYRNDLAKPQRLPFGLSASVASLGLVVVITRIGVHAQSMNPDIAQALVASALLSILVYPTAAGILSARKASPR